MTNWTRLRYAVANWLLVLTYRVAPRDTQLLAYLAKAAVHNADRCGESRS